MSTDNAPRAYELPNQEYAIVQEVKNHPHLGAWPATVLQCVLTKSMSGFARQITPGQEKIIRDLARERGVKLPT